MDTIISTYTRRQFDYLDPNPDTIELIDIAKGLSNVCRFSGQLDEFYSVAQHSVLVSMLVKEEYALEALLHDAAEAYMGDVPTPLKRLLPEYNLIEKSIMKQVNISFGLGDSEVSAKAIKKADHFCLLWEASSLKREDWEPGVVKDAAPIEALPPRDAYWLFLDRFDELTQA